MNPYKGIPFSVLCIASNGITEEINFYRKMKDTKVSIGQMGNAEVCADNATYFQEQLDLVKDAMKSSS